MQEASAKNCSTRRLARSRRFPALAIFYPSEASPIEAANMFAECDFNVDMQKDTMMRSSALVLIGFNICLPQSWNEIMLTGLQAR